MATKTSSKENNSWMAYVEKLDALLEEYLLKKAPALPSGGKEFIVKFGPWISLVLGIMLLPVVFAIFGIGLVAVPASYMAGAGWGMSYTLSVAVAAVQLVLQFASIPGLMNRQLKGWRLAWWATLIGALYSLVSFSIFGLVVGTLLGFYILYQVKSFYK